MSTLKDCRKRLSRLLRLQRREESALGKFHVPGHLHALLSFLLLLQQFPLKPVLKNYVARWLVTTSNFIYKKARAVRIYRSRHSYQTIPSLLCESLDSRFFNAYRVIRGEARKFP
jgi:hypothetical protein